MKMLDRAESPRAVKVISGWLEKSTGLSISDVANWYTANGYFRLGAMYGTSSYAGKTVTLDTALESAALYAGVKMIAEDMGTMPFHTYRRSKDHKSTERDYDSPYYTVLHDLVNPEVGAGEFVEALTAHAILTGNGFAQIQRFDSGVYLWPWYPGDTWTDRSNNGTLFYIHRELGGNEKTYPRTDVFHLRGFTLDCTNGDQILRRARHALGLTLAIDEFAGRYFSHGSALDVILERPAGISPLTPEGLLAVKKLWKEWHQGSRHSHEVAVLQEGMQAKIITPNAKDSQLMEVRTFQILEVCRLLRLPPHKLAEMTHATFTNIGEQNIEYFNQTLNPWVGRWRGAVYRCLLTLDERAAGAYAEHDRRGFLAGDFEKQAEGFRKLLEKGVYCINDVLRLLNMNPIEGGDVHFIQLNLGTVAEIAAGLNLPNAIVPVKPKEPPQATQ